MEAKENPAGGGAIRCRVQPPTVYPNSVTGGDGLLAAYPQADTMFIAALMHEPGDIARRAMRHVEPDDFYNPVYGQLYARMRHVAEGGALTPWRVLTSVFETRWTEPGGYWHGDFLNLVAQGQGDYEAVHIAARTLVELSWRQKLQAYGQAVSEAATARPRGELDAFLTGGGMDAIRAARGRLDALLELTGVAQ